MLGLHPAVCRQWAEARGVQGGASWFRQEGGWWSFGCALVHELGLDSPCWMEGFLCPAVCGRGVTGSSTGVGFPRSWWPIAH